MELEPREDQDYGEAYVYYATSLYALLTSGPQVVEDMNRLYSPSFGRFGEIMDRTHVVRRTVERIYVPKRWYSPRPPGYGRAFVCMDSRVRHEPRFDRSKDSIVVTDLTLPEGLEIEMPDFFTRRRIKEIAHQENRLPPDWNAVKDLSWNDRILLWVEYSKKGLSAILLEIDKDELLERETVRNYVGNLARSVVRHYDWQVPIDQV